MMVSSRGSIIRLLAWQWRNTLIFTLSATVVYLTHHYLEWSWLKLPTLPLAVVGGALGIFVSFRTNSAYDRWWEGRKLWGRMINTSRHLALQVMAYLPRGPSGVASEAQRTLVLRHVAYVHALRCLLREQDPFIDQDLVAALPDELEPLKAESNPTAALLSTQLDVVTQLTRDKQIDEFQLSNFDLTIRQLLDIQGGCERIKKTPMPRGYGYIAERLVQFFSVLFPMAVVAELGIWTIPISLLVCMAFALISEAGRVLEDPFTMFFNGLPLSSISRMIEVNVRERLGDDRATLPPLIGPDNRGILM